tara:strand:+ start:55 stop:693 length:639 start_codon:yes stop_codon:yes gene_type:complete
MKMYGITAAHCLILSGVSLISLGCEDSQSSSSQKSAGGRSAKSSQERFSSAPDSNLRTAREIEDALIGCWAPDVKATIQEMETSPGINPQQGVAARAMVTRILDSLVIEIPSRGRFSIHMMGQEEQHHYHVDSIDKKNEILHVKASRGAKEQPPDSATFDLDGDNLIFSTGEGGLTDTLILYRIDRDIFEQRLNLDSPEISGDQREETANEE